jgi:hypothetical protein
LVVVVFSLFFFLFVLLFSFVLWGGGGGGPPVDVIKCEINLILMFFLFLDLHSAKKTDRIISKLIIAESNRKCLVSTS